MRLRVASAVVLVLAALVGGCGGDDSASAEAEWADSVCSPFVQWRNEMRELVESLQGSSDPIETLRDGGERASEATDELLRELEGAGAPPDGAGGAAGTLEGLLTSLRAARDTLEEQLGQLDALGAPAAAAALGLIAGQVAGAVEGIERTFSSLRTSSEGLERGFQDAEACGELNGG